MAGAARSPRAALPAGSHRRRRRGAAGAGGPGAQRSSGLTPWLCRRGSRGPERGAQGAAAPLRPADAVRSGQGSRTGERKRGRRARRASERAGRRGLCGAGRAGSPSAVQRRHRPANPRGDGALQCGRPRELPGCSGEQCGVCGEPCPARLGRGARCSLRDGATASPSETGHPLPPQGRGDGFPLGDNGGRRCNSTCSLSACLSVCTRDARQQYGPKLNHSNAPSRRCLNPSPHGMAPGDDTPTPALPHQPCAAPQNPPRCSPLI